MRILTVGVVTCALVIGSVADAASPSEGVKASDLNWLAGTWMSNSGGESTVEQFNSEGGGMILGTSRTVEDGAVSFFEYMQFVDTADGLVFRPSPFGEAGVSFAAQGDGDGSIEFVNAENQFPSLIRYRLVDENTLEILVRGEQGGEPLEINFQLTKQLGAQQ